MGADSVLNLIFLIVLLFWSLLFIFIFAFVLGFAYGVNSVFDVESDFGFVCDIDFDVGSVFLSFYFLMLVLIPISTLYLIYDFDLVFDFYFDRIFLFEVSRD